MIDLAPDETLLGLIMARPAHGYQLLAHFRDPAALGHVWNLSQSQLYAVLKRLEGRKLIDGETVASSNAPSRNVFCITGEGKICLHNWLADPSPSANIRAVRVMFLSRLYIARLLNLPTSDIVRAQKRVCQDRRQRLIDERTQLAGGIGFLAVEFMIFQQTAVLDWIDRCELAPRNSRD